MKTFLILFILLLSTATAWCQTCEVTGTVKNLHNQPVADVIVKTERGGRSLAYTTTDQQGRYTLRFEWKEEVTLIFSHVAYEREEIFLKEHKGKQSQDVILIPRTITLREVKVKAPSLQLMGDTLSYNLASFLGKGDVTLEDGLKRLPGIEVSGTGAIRYMGRPISKFYIEGLDMLDGRYNLATKNIPAEYTSQVQVLRHHKEKKMDADEESANVALNIKLTKKAKFKPFGEPIFGAGRMEKKALYAAGVTGMMFTDNFQTIVSAKGSNHGDFGSYDMIDHFGNSNVSSLATSKLGKWGGGQPPVGEYRHQTNGYGSLNGILKLDTTRQVRANINYTYEENRNSFSTQTIYLGEGLNTSITETTRPWTRLHRPMLELKYEDNATNHYFCDNLRVKAQFEENTCPVSTFADDSSPVITTLNHQHRSATALNIANNFQAKVRIGRQKWSLTSNVQLQRSPSVVLTMNDLTEHAQSTSLLTSHSTAYQWKINPQWRINIPFDFRADYQMVETKQRVSGWNITPSFYPNTEWRSPDQRIYISMVATLRWLHLHYTHCAYSLPCLNPAATFRYTFSGESELRLNSQFTTSVGDILDLLTTPVHTTYRSVSAASGIIGKQQKWATDLNYKFQIPYQYFTIVANASWNQGKRNTLTAQTVSGTDVANASLLQHSHFRSATADLSISKSYIPIHTKLIFKTSGYWGTNESVSQSLLVTSYNYGFTCSGEATYNPFAWMQLTGEGRYSKGYTRRLGTIDALDAVTAIGYFALYPIENLEVKVNTHIVRQQLSATQHKSASLLGASAQYKTKRAVWKLTLQNLLNTRRYAYATYTATDCYTYDCHLLGRTMMLSCKLHLVKGAKE
ncbi:MAG: hypothetical protein IJP75_04100 [Bacteroidaceae bacterium]|nr:hypothetical protein [Bacteroidaceae bacterium]